MARSGFGILLSFSLAVHVSAWACWGSWWGGVRGGEGERDVRASRSRALVPRPFDIKKMERPYRYCVVT